MCTGPFGAGNFTTVFFLTKFSSDPSQTLLGHAIRGPTFVNQLRLYENCGTLKF